VIRSGDGYFEFEVANLNARMAGLLRRLKARVR
jgi:hypothetical protein